MHQKAILSWSKASFGGLLLSITHPSWSSVVYQGYGETLFKHQSRVPASSLGTLYILLIWGVVNKIDEIEEKTAVQRIKLTCTKFCTWLMSCGVI